MGRRKAYDRNEVLARAMELFWKAGFEGAHLSELVKVTGLNRFSLYKEFGGKQGLFEVALRRYLESARGAYARHLKRKPYGLDSIRSYFSAQHYGPDYHGCFMISTLTEQHVVSGWAFEMAKRLSKDAEGLYFKNLEAAKSHGDLSEETDPRVLAKLFLVVDHGLAIYGISRPDNRAKSQVIDLLLERVLRASSHA